MQTYKSELEIPREWRESQQSLRRHMKGWTYVFLSDEDMRQFVEREYPDFLKTYDSFPHHIQRVDAVRPLWLKRYGGIYMDLDYRLERPLDHLFTDPDIDVWLVRSGNVGSVANNSFMASRPNAKLWDYYIEHMKNPRPLWALGKHWHVMTTTGPLALQSALSKCGSDRVAFLPASQMM